jgi:hypothetical protein
MDIKQPAQAQAPGHPVAPAPAPATVVYVNNQGPAHGMLRRSWLVAILLAVFLGWLGVDRFYLGRAGVGILKLFTGGLFGILWVIDVLMILTKSVRGIEWR